MMRAHLRLTAAHQEGQQLEIAVFEYVFLPAPCGKSHEVCAAGT